MCTGGSEKGQSLISAYRSLAITASTSGFEKLSMVLLFVLFFGIPSTPAIYSAGHYINLKIFPAYGLEYTPLYYGPLYCAEPEIFKHACTLFNSVHCALSFASLCSSSSHCYSKTKFEARVCICASAYNTRQQSQGSLINYVVTWGSL